jgi:hypothetical protein
VLAKVAENTPKESNYSSPINLRHILADLHINDNLDLALQNMAIIDQSQLNE